MTLEELKNYRSYCLEFNELSNKLKNSTSEESTVGILYRIKELSGRIEDIEQYVENIEDYIVYRAIKMYCIEPLDENVSAPSWEKVADRIGNGMTGDSIRVRVSRYIKNLEKNS